MKLTRRPMTVVEREALEARIALAKQPDFTFLSLFMWLFALPATTAIVGGALGGFDGVLFGGLVGGIVGSRSVYRQWRGLSRRARRETEPLRKDIEAGEVEVLDLSVRDAVRIEPAEDEGALFLLDIGDGKLLFRYRYDYDDYDEDGVNVGESFPLQKLTIVRTKSGRTLDEIAEGAYVPPSTTREHITGEEYDQVAALRLAYDDIAVPFEGALAEWRTPRGDDRGS